MPVGQRHQDARTLAVGIQYSMRGGLVIGALPGAVARVRAAAGLVHMPAEFGPGEIDSQADDATTGA